MASPSRCWHCGGKLARWPKSKGDGTYSVVIKENLGYAVHVHMTCQPDAEAAVRGALRVGYRQHLTTPEPPAAKLFDKLE